MLYPGRTAFRNKGEMKSFTKKQKLKDFLTTRPASPEIPQAMLQPEVKVC